ncbi:hypothetical protein BJV77DRAFT_1058533 [Russula vinacea]|nr:hypothetical protein BJV77DRAFT_1058533 [Russula vinacea]
MSRLSTSTSTSTSTDDSLIRRSWHAMSDLLSPFSPAALAQLPKKPRRPSRYTRADAIPDMPRVRDYHSITTVPPHVRVPKKTPTPVRVEGKVWFANERTWVSYLNMSVLIGTFAVALFNASKDPIASNVGILVYGYVLYQRRITMIRRRDPGNFDQIAGPVIISALLFFAILANFILRGALRFPRKGNVTIPGLAFLTQYL